MCKLVTRHLMGVPHYEFQAILEGDNRVVHIENDRMINEEDGFDLVSIPTEEQPIPRLIRASVEYVEMFTTDEGEFLGVTLELEGLVDEDGVFMIDEDGDLVEI